MNEVQRFELPEHLQTALQRRDWICELEKTIRNNPNSEESGTKTCPLIHQFADGMYARTGFMPAGSVIVGKIHRYETINILHEGVMSVITEDGGAEIYEAPRIFTSPAGCKKALYIIEDCYFTNVNRNRTDTRDLKELEDSLIVKDYDSFEIENRGESCG